MGFFTGPIAAGVGRKVLGGLFSKKDKPSKQSEQIVLSLRSEIRGLARDLDSLGVTSKNGLSWASFAEEIVKESKARSDKGNNQLKINYLRNQLPVFKAAKAKTNKPIVETSDNFKVKTLPDSPAKATSFGPLNFAGFDLNSLIIPAGVAAAFVFGPKLIKIIKKGF